MPVFAILIVIVAVIGGFGKVGGMFARDPVWSMELSDRDARSLAMTILTQGEVRGCGLFTVTDQHPRLKQITVTCSDGAGGRQTHDLRYAPDFSVDGTRTSSSGLESMYVSNAYCVKRADGTWDKAYLDPYEAATRAERISRQDGAGARVYEANSLIYSEARQDEDGKWFAPRIDEVQSRDEREGCELETRRLAYEAR